MFVRKAYEELAEVMKNKIERGEWPAGSRLDSVEKMAEKFQVGRSTVREALMVLKAQGLVDIRQGGGTFVTEWKKIQQWLVPQVSDAVQLQEWLEVRFALETHGAYLAAKRHQDHDLARLEAALAAMADSRDEDEAEQADTRFHLAIAAASGNRLLHGALKTLFSSMDSAMKESRGLWLFAEHAPAGKLLEEHRRILEKIRTRQAVEAKRLMASHLRKVERYLQG